MREWQLGAYELERPLGEGGMAQVYLARDVRLGREVAVKVLDPHLAERPGFRERFLREARVAAALDHPNIVPLFDFGESGALYLVMPFISGGSVQDMLRKTPLSMGTVVSYGSQIADALEFAHQRSVVHRDVKPANMLIHADGRVMLSDFGLAKILDNSPRPMTPRGHPDAGTPEYMAPEQIEGRTDERSDIYALGVVLYLLLTGHLPFTGTTSQAVMDAHLYRLPESPRRLNPAISPAMEAVVLRALAKLPQERFQKASELGAALLSALIAGDVEAPAVTPRGLSLPSSLPPIRTPISPLGNSAEAAWPLGQTAGALPQGGMPQGGMPQGGMPHAPRVTSRPLARSGPVPFLSAPNTTASRMTGGMRGTDAPMPSLPAQSIGSGLGMMGIGSSAAQTPLGSMPTGLPSLGQASRASLARITAPVPAVSPLSPSLAGTPSPVSPPSATPSSPSEPASRRRTAADEQPRGQRTWLVLLVLLILLLAAAAILLRWIQLHPNGLFG